VGCSLGHGLKRILRWCGRRCLCDKDDAIVSLYDRSCRIKARWIAATPAYGMHCLRCSQPVLNSRFSQAVAQIEHAAVHLGFVQLPGQGVECERYGADDEVSEGVIRQPSPRQVGPLTQLEPTDLIPFPQSLFKALPHVRDGTQGRVLESDCQMKGMRPDDHLSVWSVSLHQLQQVLRHIP
jgi:hypothetical protein